MPERSIATTTLERAYQRADRFDNANLIGKAALIVTGRAAMNSHRETIRRDQLGAEGRIAEDVAAIVHESTEVHELLSEKAGRQDGTLAEFQAAQNSVKGDDSEYIDPEFHLSITSRGQLEVAVVSGAVKGIAHDPSIYDQMDSYRYGALIHTSPSGIRQSRTYIVPMIHSESGDGTVLPAVPLDLLSFEASFGFSDNDLTLTGLEGIVSHDLEQLRTGAAELRSVDSI